MRTHIGRLALLAALLAGMLIHPARAQSGASLTLAPPDLSAFPDIHALFDVRDAQGFFVPGLAADNFTILEDGQELRPATVTELRPGADLVVAVNPGQAFAIRDSQGATRYEKLAPALLAWLDTQAANPGDRLSLVTPDGVLANHTPDAATWRAAFQGYAPVTDSFLPGLEMLGAALDLAADPLPAPGMGRAALLITPVVSNEAAAALASLAERANASGVRVHVWLIDSPLLFESANAIALRALAADTGGQFTAFSGEETLPDLYALFESSRRVYELSYRSRLNVPGQHSLALRVVSPQASVASATLFFDLALQPPNPVFVSPPVQVVRFIPEGEPIALENLQPKQQSFEILIDFPDTVQRTIVRTALYVNGELAAENSAAPFEVFTLDLDAFVDSQRLLLVAEAEDELGLTGRSIETPVELTVRRPETGVSAMIARNVTVVAAVSAIAAGLLLILVLVMGGRLRPRPMSDATRARPAANDPVTQPIPLRAEPVAQNAAGPLQRAIQRLTAPRLRWPQRQAPAQPFAYLARLGEGGEPIGDGIVSIQSREITFGSDPAQAAIPLEDPAVEPLHARIWRDEQDCFHLADAGSVAGTWLNYAPVSREGSRLEHGDLVHIGRVGFRFSLSVPGRPRKAVVTRLSSDDKEGVE
ncbi:MAG: FHA domain-containing protein [Chloroflexi bacterium]|nr:FHA domain-containing protein [Chloroflexota bacterium]